MNHDDIVKISKIAYLVIEFGPKNQHVGSLIKNIFNREYLLVNASYIWYCVEIDDNHLIQSNFQQRDGGGNGGYKGEGIVEEDLVEEEVTTSRNGSNNLGLSRSEDMEVEGEILRLPKIPALEDIPMETPSPWEKRGQGERSGLDMRVATIVSQVTTLQ